MDPESTDMDTLSFEYRFSRDESARQTYRLELDARTLEALAPAHEDSPPEWARLAFHQCPGCPLSAAEVTWCPLARRLADLQPLFEDVISWQEMDVEVTTPERTMVARTTAQRALGSLMGLLMPVSGCPHTRYFRPMARFHLPFASEDETIFRACGMYLLAQYFLDEDDADAGSGLDGLETIYEQLQEVNRHIARRLREGTSGDSMVNAVVLLDMLARALPWAIQDRVEELRPLFSAYLARD